MFDRLKSENEQRKMEVHGLKDILVRENDHRIRESEELRMAMELSAQKLGEALERECIDMDQVGKRVFEVAVCSSLSSSLRLELVISVSY